MSGQTSGARAPILFVRGQSAYGILSHFARDWGAALEQAGQPVHHLDLHAAGSEQALEDHLASGTFHAVVGFSGAGVPTEPGEDPPLYERLRIPYIGMMLDHPVWVPGRHRIGSPWVNYLFSDADHCRDSLAMSPPGAVRLGFRFGMQRFDAPIRPLAERRLPALYAKHGGDPEGIRGIWMAADRKHRESCEAVAEMVLASGDLTAWEATAQYLACQARGFDALDPVHLGVVQLVDIYVRRVRATRMLQALLPHQVVVVGGDWAHVERGGTRASFVPGQELPALLALLDQTRVVVNVQPLNRHAPQERIIYGMQRGCVVATDASPILRDALGADRISQFVWNDTLDAQVADFLTAGATDQQRADAAADHARHCFDLATCAVELVATIDALVAGCTRLVPQVATPGADTLKVAPPPPRLSTIGL